MSHLLAAVQPTPPPSHRKAEEETALASPPPPSAPGWDPPQPPSHAHRPVPATPSSQRPWPPQSAGHRSAHCGPAAPASQASHADPRDCFFGPGEGVGWFPWRWCRGGPRCHRGPVSVVPRQPWQVAVPPRLARGGKEKKLKRKLRKFEKYNKITSINNLMDLMDMPFPYTDI